jgi:GT2 family glycosyltransferase
VILALEGEGSPDPAEIDRLVDALVRGADVAKGSRFLPGGESNDVTASWRAWNWLLCRLVNILFRVRYTDLCSAYHGFWAQHLPLLLDGIVGSETSLSVRAAKAGLRVVEVPAYERNRLDDRRDTRSFRRAWRLLRAIWREWTVRRGVPRPEAVAGPGLALPKQLDSTTRRSNSRSPSKPLRVSVVVCARASNDWESVCNAVESVTSQRLEPHEIVVVVDHDTRLLTRARRELTDATVLANRGPVGLAAARNTGLAHAAGNVIAFLDDDAVASPDWLEHLIAWYRFHSVVGVGGAIVPLWRDGRPSRFPRELDWALGCTYDGLTDGPRRVPGLVGANMSFRRSALLSIGGFRSRNGRYPAAFEEQDACIRLACAVSEATLVHEPRAVVHRPISRDCADLRFFSARCYAEGRSKARLAAQRRHRDAWVHERTSSRGTLTRAVARGIFDCARGDASGAGRAGMIALGALIAATGYCAARIPSVFAGSDRESSESWLTVTEADTSSR